MKHYYPNKFNFNYAKVKYMNHLHDHWTYFFSMDPLLLQQLHTLFILSIKPLEVCYMEMILPSYIFFRLYLTFRCAWSCEIVCLQPHSFIYVLISLKNTKVISTAWIFQYALHAYLSQTQTIMKSRIWLH